MVEGCQDASLFAETFANLLVPGESGGQALDGDGTIEPDMTPSDHLTHCPSAELAEDFIARKRVLQAARRCVHPL